jgi:hypothetical protein
MQPRLLALLLLPLAALAALPARGQSGQPIGSTLVVVSRVTAELAQQARTLQMGDNVRQDELIEVSPDGKSELKLYDETKLALGPGARLLLDKFVYDSERSSGTIALNLIKGSFRFITGLAAKRSYLVRVPNASITVRGTIFDVYIQEDNVVWLLLHEGAVRVCNDVGQCRILDTPGELIRIAGDRVGAPSRWASLPSRQSVVFDDAFPFVATAPLIDPDPIFTREAILIGRHRHRYPGDNHDGPGKSTDPNPEKRTQDTTSVRKHSKKHPGEHERTHTKVVHTRHAPPGFSKSVVKPKFVKSGLSFGRKH